MQQKERRIPGQARDDKLARQSLEDFEPTLQCSNFAMRELANAAFESCVSDGRTIEPIASVLREPERQPATVIRVGLPVDQPSAYQDVDRTTDRRRAAFHSCGDLVERRRLSPLYRSQKGALLALRLGCGHVGTQLLDQPREPRRQCDR
jgi:hypothetical protein